MHIVSSRAYAFDFILSFFLPFSLEGALLLLCVKCWTDLVWAYTAGVEVGVAGGRVNGVLLKVFTDVLCGGLRQQPVDALPEEQQGRYNWQIYDTAASKIRELH